MKSFHITVHNTLPFPRPNEPVTLGIPFAQGDLRDPAALCVRSASGQVLPSQSSTQSRWPDGTVRWALLHFLGDLEAGAPTRFCVSRDTVPDTTSPLPPLQVAREVTRVSVNTGALRFDIDAATFRGLEKVKLRSRTGDAWVDVLATSPFGSLYLKEKDGKLYTAQCGKVRRFDIEAGPLVCTINVEGELADESGAAIVEYDLWLRVFAGQTTVRAWLTLRNPRPAIRRVLGQWPLGLPGSIYFKEAGWQIMPRQDGVSYVTLHAGGAPYPQQSPGTIYPLAQAGNEVYRGPFTQSASLVQDSSGGENWFHRSHVNRDWTVPLSYRGWKAFVDGAEIRQGNRAEPFIAIEDPRLGVAMGIRHFWQNFPKAIRADKGPDGRATATLALWPCEFADLHELQGGEQKTHELVFHFYRGDNYPNVPVPYSQWPETAIAMARALNPPLALAAASQYADSRAFDHLALYDDARAPRYERINESSILAPRNLFTQQESIDNFGWRNFGDVLADCEIQGRVLSHYNLEYDMGYAMLMQAARTADARPDLCQLWWKLAEPALRHEADIDVYHTSDNAHTGGVYCHGKHHHTDHAYEAGRSTHRAYEEDGMQGNLAWYHTRGGGPESQHMNTRGMLTYGWMAGYPATAKVAKAMADLIVYKVTTGRFAQTGQFFRDSGHNVQILLEGYWLTGDEKYLRTAETVIDAGHPDRQPWAAGFPVKGDGAADMQCWGGSIFLKETARYLETRQAQGAGQGDKGYDRALSLLITAVEHFNRWAWDEDLGRFAHTVRADGTQFRYKEPWWDLKILEMVAWACRWQDNPRKRALWLARASATSTSPAPPRPRPGQARLSPMQVFLRLRPERPGISVPNEVIWLLTKLKVAAASRC